MRIAIIRLPGSSSTPEINLAVQRAGMEPVEWVWNPSRERLADCAGYIIAGDFSGKSRSRTHLLTSLNPVMTVITEQSDLGKPVLGISCGAQIVVETGLVPGIARHQIGMALTDNQRMRDGDMQRTGFYNDQVNIRLTDHFQYNAFTRFLTPKTILSVPLAHAQACFVIPPGLLAEMQVQGLGLFQYCDVDGNILDDLQVNPAGSVNNIAAVSSKAGNVMAMLPHPERTPDGDAIFRSMRDYLAKGHTAHVTPLHYQPRVVQSHLYRAAAGAAEWLVTCRFADTEALAVEQVLREHHMPVRVACQEHWEIVCDSPAVLEKIRQTGVLYNAHEQTRVAAVKTDGERVYLIRPQEDWIALEKTRQLENDFGIHGIRSLRHGRVWRLAAENDLPVLAERVIQSPLLFNPCTHDCYRYQG